MANSKGGSKDNKNNLMMNIGANVDMSSFKKAISFMKASITSMQKVINNMAIPPQSQVKPELSTGQQLEGETKDSLKESIKQLYFIA